MMVAMHDINDLPCFRIFTHEVKNKPVHQVFKKRPEKHAPEKKSDDLPGTKSKAVRAIINQEANHRKVHPPDHQRMGFGQYFQVLAFKQPGLTLIFDLIKTHNQMFGQIYCKKIFPRQSLPPSIVFFTFSLPLPVAPRPAGTPGKRCHPWLVRWLNNPPSHRDTRRGPTEIPRKDRAWTGAPRSAHRRCWYIPDRPPVRRPRGNGIND